MSKTVINKLVRDYIPSVIADSGSKVTFHAVKDNEGFQDLLRDKLVEEATEFANAKTEENIIEELADVMEVVEAIMAIFGIHPGDIEQKKRDKILAKGGFHKGYILDYIENQD